MNCMIHEVGRAGVGVHLICKVKKLETLACALGRVNCGMHNEMLNVGRRATVRGVGGGGQTEEEKQAVRDQLLRLPGSQVMEKMQAAQGII